jgi:acid phosphatase
MIVTSLVRSTALVLAAAVLVACGGTGAASPEGGHTPTQASATPPSVVPVTKLLLVVVENHSLAEMRRGMPYTFRLARKYGYATRFHAITHPSLPNYLAIAGGSTFGVLDDASPSSHPVHGNSVFGQAVTLGKTARVYAEGMPRRCALESGGRRYAVKHNPWAYFVGERHACHRNDVSLATLRGDIAAGELPNAGMVVPNLCHDAHDMDCSLGDADRWLRRLLRPVLAGPDFAAGRLAVVVTADEDDYSQGNRVLATVLHPSQHGHVVRAALDHTSLTRLYDEVLGAPLLRGARSAPDLAAAFGLPTAAS